MESGFLVFLSIFYSYLVVSSIKDVLIGTGKIRHPMYDSDEKRAHLRRKGTILLSVMIVLSVCILVFLVIYI